MLCISRSTGVGVGQCLSGMGSAVARLNNVVAPAGESIQTRRVMPLPHGHVTMALTAQHNGVLDWHWLWAHVATPIVADAALTTACTALLDCLRADGTNQAGPIVPSTSRASEMADDPTGHLIGAAWCHVNNHLEGLRAPVGIATQLLALQSTTNTTGTNLNVSLCCGCVAAST